MDENDSILPQIMSAITQNKKGVRDLRNQKGFRDKSQKNEVITKEEIRVTASQQLSAMTRLSEPKFKREFNKENTNIVMNVPNQKINGSF